MRLLVAVRPRQCRTRKIRKWLRSRTNMPSAVGRVLLLGILGPALSHSGAWVLGPGPGTFSISFRSPAHLFPSRRRWVRLARAATDGLVVEDKGEAKRGRRGKSRRLRERMAAPAAGKAAATPVPGPEGLSGGGASEGL